MIFWRSHLCYFFLELNTIKTKTLSSFSLFVGFIYCQQNIGKLRCTTDLIEASTYELWTLYREGFEFKSIQSSRCDVAPSQWTNQLKETAGLLWNFLPWSFAALTLPSCDIILLKPSKGVSTIRWRYCFNLRFRLVKEAFELRKCRWKPFEPRLQTLNHARFCQTETWS